MRLKPIKPRKYNRTQSQYDAGTKALLLSFVPIPTLRWVRIEKGTVFKIGEHRKSTGPRVPLAHAALMSLLDGSTLRLAALQTHERGSVGSGGWCPVRGCEKNNYSARRDTLNRQCLCGFSHCHIRIAKPMVGPIRAILLAAILPNVNQTARGNRQVTEIVQTLKLLILTVKLPTLSHLQAATSWCGSVAVTKRNERERVIAMPM